MPISGYVDYRRREYCKDIRCPVQTLLAEQEPDSREYEAVREICRTKCLHTTHEFHHWLTGKGYSIVRPER